MEVVDIASLNKVVLMATFGITFLLGGCDAKNEFLYHGCSGGFIGFI